MAKGCDYPESMSGCGYPTTILETCLQGEVLAMDIVELLYSRIRIHMHKPYFSGFFFYRLPTPFGCFSSGGYAGMLLETSRSLIWIPDRHSISTCLFRKRHSDRF